MNYFNISSYDYHEKVYAGVLGKVIGIYHGLPVEGWSHADIVAKYGEISGPVHAERGWPLVATSDDLTGCFALPRLLARSGSGFATTARQFGLGWLDLHIKRRTALFWGGLGVASEHSAWIRLNAGIDAPESGSAALNGLVTAGQIGGRIFCDSFAMLCPGDPELAGELAARSASVTHDGVGVEGARMWAAMEAAAFIEQDPRKILAIGLERLPVDSPLRAACHAAADDWGELGDWRAVLGRISARDGYDRWRGVCHIIPNQALAVLALLAGAGDLRKTLTIAATAGWDADCNCCAVGCLLGIRDGVSAFTGLDDWRVPVADRLYVGTANGGGVITDALREADALVDLGRRLHGVGSCRPKGGARFHFGLPGAVQGWRGQTTYARVRSQSHSAFGICLELAWKDMPADEKASAASPTWVPEEARPALKVAREGSSHGFFYNLMACPTLHGGQTVMARVIVEVDGPVALNLWVQQSDGRMHAGPRRIVDSDSPIDLTWRVPEVDAVPVALVGITAAGAPTGRVLIDRIGWMGSPIGALFPFPGMGADARHAWIDACDCWTGTTLSHDCGRGMIFRGTDEWKNYTLEAVLETDLAGAIGLAVLAQGLTWWHAVSLSAGGVRLVRRRFDQEDILATGTTKLNYGRHHRLRLSIGNDRISAEIDGETLVAELPADPGGGAAALIVDDGMVRVISLHISSLSTSS